MDSMLLPRSRNRLSSIIHGNLSRPEHANRLVIDYFTQFDEITTDRFLDVITKDTIKNNDSLSSPHLFRISYIIALFILGVSVALIGYFQEYTVQALHRLRLMASRRNIFAVDSIIWVVISMVFCLIAGILSSFIPKSAQESEIAEVKAVITGVKIPMFFGFKVLIFKLLSVIFAVSGGISMGTEGAFVHISAIISNQVITKIKKFNYIYENKSLRSQFIASSVAAGLASRLGTVIGALMFSIEITSSYYIVSNLWRSAFCSLCCCIIKELLQLTHIEEIIKNYHFDSIEISLEIFLFAALGILSGLLGSLFIFLSRLLLIRRLNKTSPRLHKRLVYILLICLISAILTSFKTYLMRSDITVLNDMYHYEIKSAEWHEGSIGMNLLVYFCIKFLITVLATSLELPVGIIFPLLACGAVFGRLFGQLASDLFGNQYMNIYAAVGSAALVSATTHSITVSIMVFSMTGEIHYLVPMILAVFLSYGVSNIFTISFYDTILSIKKINYIPLLQSPEMYDLSADDIMVTEFPCLTTESSLRELIDAVFNSAHEMIKIPVINQKGELIYDISIESCKSYFERCYNRDFYNLKINSQEVITEIIRKLQKKRHRASFGEKIENKPKRGKSKIAQSKQVKKFLDQLIDFNDEYLDIDDAPFSILDTIVFAKIQFMFFMLNITQVYVTEKGVLVGMIFRDEFKRLADQAMYGN